MSDRKLRKATFAAGCFWGVEDKFRKVEGVVSTRVGYAGGTTDHPTYEEVCTGKTGHAESVEIEYDPDQVSYDELLDKFWSIHNPTTKDRQGPDVGSQYRSVIFYHSPEQKRVAIKSRDELEESARYEDKVVTEIVPSSRFYEAEEYHQQYFEKKRDCQSVQCIQR